MPGQIEEVLLLGSDRVLNPVREVLRILFPAIPIRESADGLGVIGAFLAGELAVQQLAERGDGFPACIAVDKPAQLALEKLGQQPLMVLKSHWGYQDIQDALYRLYSVANSPVDVAGILQGCPALVAESTAMQEVLALVAKLENRAVTVLINGPSGAGKEVIARTVHQLSERREAPFIPINCGAIPKELLESELFGHEKGAFTGAVNSRAGRFELAAGGTLFLDEIGDMPLDMQVKLLRVLQEKVFQRVGSNQDVSADVRIIAATHRDLEKMIAEGDFREDLFYRLNVFPIDVPALAERREDIPSSIRKISLELEAEGLGCLQLTAGAVCALQAYAWPGNIRELANLLERMLIIHSERPVGIGDLPERYRVSGDDEPWRERAPDELEAVKHVAVELLPEQGVDIKLRIAELEMGWIKQAMEHSEGVVSRAAQLLGLRRTTLIEKMRKYGLS